MSVVVVGRAPGDVCGAIQRWVAAYRWLVEPYTVCASVITASASTSHRPLSRSMVRIDTVPSPEKVGGRRTARHATIVRVRWRPEIREAKRERGSQPDARPRTPG